LVGAVTSWGDGDKAYLYSSATVATQQRDGTIVLYIVEKINKDKDKDRIMRWMTGPL
jgi:hypothetical protein